METTNFTLTLVTEQSPEDVFRAIKTFASGGRDIIPKKFTEVRKNLTTNLVFRAANGAHYNKQKLVEVITNKKIVWLIIESKFTFIEKHDEWTGSKVIFEISEKGGKTQLVFTHEGLTPEVECYDACAPSWTQYLQNKLLPMITALAAY